MRWNVGLEPMTRIRREDPGTGDSGWGSDGRWLAPTEASSTPFDGTIDPVPDEFLDVIPEGSSRKDAIYIITETDLRVDDDDVTPQEYADVIVRDGKRYKIHHVERFARLIVHWEAVAVREKG